MAAIDKIYITGWTNYCKFREWVEAQPPFQDKYGKTVRMIDYLRKFNTVKDWTWDNNSDPETECHPVMNNPYYIDALIIRGCPLEFVQKELMLSYGHHDQEYYDDAYDTVKKRAAGEYDGDFFSWLTLDDFEIVDGKPRIKNEEVSDYTLIKEGKLYTSPRSDSNDFAKGKHCKMIDDMRSHGWPNVNTPARGCWWIDIQLPDQCKRGKYEYMWYHADKWNGAGTWDFIGDFVEADGCSSTALCQSIKALKRWIRKWELPIGTVVTATGRYVVEKYVFIVTK